MLASFQQLLLLQRQRLGSETAVVWQDVVHAGITETQARNSPMLEDIIKDFD